MTKIMFVLHRLGGTTREGFSQNWASQRHVSIVRRVPGLRRWVRNHCLPSSQGEPTYDGIGELWFDTPESLQTALGSAEFADAMEDARQFIDLEKSQMVIVEEVNAL